jgi:hypothetical protein
LSGSLAAMARWRNLAMTMSSIFVVTPGLDPGVLK